jgi:amino acid adenylation domain-containing protein
VSAPPGPGDPGATAGAQTTGGYQPVTAGQQRLWFLAQIEPGSLEYHIPLAFRLRGPLDPAALVAALEDVVERHAALRTRFPVVDGEPVQVVVDGWRLPVEVIEVTGPDSERRVAPLVAERANAPFDLAAAVPLRAALLRLRDEHHVLCLVIHHILADGWSLDLLYDELSRGYAARREGHPAALPPLPLQYPDYAREQHRRSARGRPAAIEYWTRRLAGAQPLDLPTDAPRPAGRATGGAFDGHRLGAAAAADLRRLCRTGRTTPFMTLLAGYAALLGLYTGQPDVCIGSPVSGRDRTELEPLIGFFLNTVVLRADLSGDPSFRELLSRVRATALEAFSHPELPAEQVVSALRLRRDPARNPLFDTMLVVHGGRSGRGLALPGVTVEYVDPGHRAAKFDLILDCFATADELEVVANYRTDLFRPATVEALVRRLGALLGQAAADPDQPLSVLYARLAAAELAATALAAGEAALAEGEAALAEGEAEVRGGCAPPGADREPGVLELFAAQVAAAPEAVAVAHAGARLSYAELDRRAHRLAAVLRARGVAPGSLVGVCLPSGPDLVTALLAVLVAGAAYLPLDGDHPAQRLRYLLADSGAAVVVTTGALRGRLPGEVAAVDLDAVAWTGAAEPGPLSPAPSGGADRAGPSGGADRAAYAIYTSGSTGAPKAVLVSHGALAARVRWMADAYRITPADRVLQFSSPSFDAFGEELYPCLVRGATLVIPTGPRSELPDLLAGPDTSALTVLDLPTAYWHELVADLPAAAWPPGLRLLILGGEQVRPDALARWFATVGDRVEVVNTYGPTETTIIATAARLTAADAAGRPAIGYPIAGTCLHLLGGYGAPVPDGVPGELLIGGAGLAGGYLNRPELTAERFAPWHGRPHYRTGDRVRRRPDGALEFLGRLDRQLKVRGYRVEPGEVEAALVGHPGVRHAVVVGDRGRLVAYLVPAPGGEAPTAVALRTHLAGLLPGYLHPEAYGVLERLPLTPTGKIDFLALPPVAATGGSGAEPRTDGERLIARVWRDVLGVERIGAGDDFFDLGGHSLLATRVAARLRSATGIEVPLRTIFLRTTVAELAGAVEELLIAEIESLAEDEVERLLAESPGAAP